MPSIFSKLPLRISAPIVLSLPVLIAVAVLSLIAFWQARSAANKMANDQIVEIHKRIDQQLGDLLSMPARINRINAQMLDEDRLDLGDLRSWRAFLYEQAMAFEMLSGILWGSAEGEAVWMFRYPGKEGYEFGIKDDDTGEEVFEYRMDAKNQMSADPVGHYEYDPRKRPWYTNAIRAGEAAWTEYAWVNQDGGEVTYGLAYPQPYYNQEGELLGVLDAEISLHDVSRFLGSLEIGRTGMAYIIDREGDLLASSVDAAVHDSDLKRIPAHTSQHGSISATATVLNNDFASLSDFEGTYHKLVKIDDQPQLMIVSPLSGHAGINWLTVTVVPEHDFLDAVYKLRRRSFYSGLVAVLVTLLLGVGMASVFVRPIFRLVSHVRKIGEGNLTEQLHLNYGPEFVQLSNEINTMTEDLRDRMRMRRSLAVAMEVQQSLLPSDTPKLEGLDVAGHSTYCDETGGDYYDFLEVAGLSEKSAAIALGDVMGHGVAAAMLMATARGVLRSRCQEPGSLSDLLNHMNRMLVEDTGGERFMTMLLLTIDLEQHEIRWTSAGHDAPIVFDKETSTFVEYEFEGSLPLGLFEQDDYEEYTVKDVRSGQILIVATDGLWETQGEHGEFYGKDRVNDLLRRHAESSAEEISQHIRKELAEFRGPLSPDDDVTFVIVKIE
ncbi:SpoIIE family protein phosphatase [Adhaeretor mobilis]|uniref:Phosphoserine phosphatase RsbU n=1 Tax=Adhaeretor mobilis TaxID=1930276 RepID=A0A517MWA5_9BACT|nr:SpoIIE family protein phosphatase [Adhaeretor mobilis]QDS99161.1 Phosphoserine phosphatase RsbU [Adhaeretor mobilis]